MNQKLKLANQKSLKNKMLKIKLNKKVNPVKRNLRNKSSRMKLKINKKKVKKLLLNKKLNMKLKKRILKLKITPILKKTRRMNKNSKYLPLKIVIILSNLKNNSRRNSNQNSLLYLYILLNKAHN